MRRERLMRSAGRKLALLLVVAVSGGAAFAGIPAFEEGNVQTLSMDEQGTARARVSDRVNRTYDYSEAIADLEEAVQQAPDIPYLHFNLGNLHCLGNEPIVSIGDYGKAIELYPDMGDAYYNRGLVLIYLKDKEKACIDLSRAGELGITDAYGVIEKYCKTEDL